MNARPDVAQDRFGLALTFRALALYIGVSEAKLRQIRAFSEDHADETPFPRPVVFPGTVDELYRREDAEAYVRALRPVERQRAGIRAAIVAALLLLGSFAQADVFDAAAITAAASDVVITETALRRGFVEQNIQNRGLRVGANIALTGGVLLAAHEVEKSGHKGWARAIKVAYTLTFVAIAGKNLHTMRGGR